MGSDQKASVYDLLPMSDFVEPLRVMDIMNTESDFLCYRYTEWDTFLNTSHGSREYPIMYVHAY